MGFANSKFLELHTRFLRNNVTDNIYFILENFFIFLNTDVLSPVIVFFLLENWSGASYMWPTCNSVTYIMNACYKKGMHSYCWSTWIFNLVPEPSWAICQAIVLGCQCCCIGFLRYSDKMLNSLFASLLAVQLCPENPLAHWDNI